MALTPELLRNVPPWLLREVGGPIMRGIGSAIDLVGTRTGEAIKLRFPVEGGDEKALALTGAERRIRRGPGETASTYARRLLRWWDAHRTRGTPYQLLQQLRDFLLEILEVPMEEVANVTGRRVLIDAAGVLSRDEIVFDGDGSGKWARFWVFIHTPATIPIGTAFLITEGGDFRITEGGDFRIVEDSIAVDELNDAELELFAAIPREWSAAHIDRIYIVLLWGEGELWDYPQPVGTWDDDPGALWDEELPVVITVEG
jgi:hypothetical protein